MPINIDALADRLSVPPERRAAFAEVVDAVGELGAKNWHAYLSKVRSYSEVASRIDELGLAKGASPSARERLIFCGRYSAKVGTPLDDALHAAADGIAAALRRGNGKIEIAVKRGRFSNEHLQCRAEAFPYRPSVAASKGAAVLEARAANDGLLGYVAMQGGGCAKMGSQHRIVPCVALRPLRGAASTPIIGQTWTTSPSSPNSMVRVWPRLCWLGLRPSRRVTGPGAPSHWTCVRPTRPPSRCISTWASSSASSHIPPFSTGTAASRARPLRVWWRVNAHPTRTCRRCCEHDPTGLHLRKATPPRRSAVSHLPTADAVLPLLGSLVVVCRPLCLSTHARSAS